MDLKTRFSLTSYFGNRVAYDHSLPLPQGFSRIDDFTGSQNSGFSVLTAENRELGVIIVAPAGTNG